MTEGAVARSDIMKHLESYTEENNLLGELEEV